MVSYNMVECDLIHTLSHDIFLGKTALSQIGKNKKLRLW